jgi:spore coat protein H
MFSAASLPKFVTAIVLGILAAQSTLYAGKAGKKPAASSPAQKSASRGPSEEERAQSDALFQGLIPVIHIQIGGKSLEKLRNEPKEYVDVILQEPGLEPLEKVGLKLKGSVGSFQTVDQRPGFSLNLEKYGKRKVFHGLSRFQLNNCNQDPTALHELLAGQIARDAGVPASRCTHALVSLNGRSLGVYVLKESFREELLGTFFSSPNGRLYDGGFCAEIRSDMELDHGPRETSSRLHELVEALSEGNPEHQLHRVRELVEVDAYLRYVALENILAHWDGYSFSRNNYRLYENPETGRFHFLLHGMDQTLGKPDWDLWRAPEAAVGSILWGDAEIRARYDVILRGICEKTVLTRDWVETGGQTCSRLLKAHASLDPEGAKAYQPRIAEATAQLRARIAAVTRQLQAGNPALLFSVLTPVSLSGRDWTPQLQNAEADPQTFDGKPCLRIRAQPNASGSWQLPLVLPKGVYRFEAMLRLQDVAPTRDRDGEGAGIRTLGASRLGKNGLTGTSPWALVSWEFASEGDTQTLVAELRADSGTLWVDRDSLKITRLK